MIDVLVPALIFLMGVGFTLHSFAYPARLEWLAWLDEWAEKRRKGP